MKAITMWEAIEKSSKLFHIFGAPILFSPTAEVADPPKTNILTNEK